MGIMGFLLRRPGAYDVRKKYDRIREKTDKLSDIEKRMEILHMLDRIDPQIVALEEGSIMTRHERKKVMDQVESDLRKMEFVLKESKRKPTEDNSSRNRYGRYPRRTR